MSDDFNEWEELFKIAKIVIVAGIVLDVVKKYQQQEKKQNKGE